MEDKFKLFLESIDESNRVFVEELNDFLIESNCKCDIKSAKSGYLVSYILKDNKRTLASFVIRKSGVKIRIYPENINNSTIKNSPCNFWNNIFNKPFRHFLV